MKHNLKPIGDQVIVITGASSGIGLATAYAAGERGAKVVLAARNKAALNQAVAKIKAAGGEAIAVQTDVSQQAQVQALADAAIRAYGGFDTWVNNAGVGIYALAEEVPDNEHRRLFDVNYFGTVYGSLVAVAHLRQRGGSLINQASILSEISVPLQGPYCASKAAVRGFTDSLRTELHHERAPISITLIKPAAIATPFPQHARNHLDREPTLPPPLYAPEDVAMAILDAAERGGRDVAVGGGAKLMLAAAKFAPGAVDFGAVLLGTTLQKKRRAPQNPTGNLFEAGEGGQTWGESSYPVMRTSKTSGKPGGRGTIAATLLLGAVAGAAALFGRKA